MDSKNPKVLVGCPTYSAMKYCSRKFIDSLKTIDYDNFDILIVDNSKDDELFNELKKEEGITAVKDDTSEEKNVKRLVSSRNKILEYGLNNEYDYVLMMDADVIAPKNILKELLLSEREIVSGLYNAPFRISGEIREMPVCWKLFTEEQFEEMKRRNLVHNYAEKREDVRRHLTKEETDSEELTEVFICSPGCMLISKKIFEKIRYGFLEREDGVLYGDDIVFLDRARKSGFKVWCNTKVKCSHLFKEKLEKGEHPMYN